MPVKKEVLEQIDTALDLYSKHRARSSFDDLSDLHDGALLTEIGTVVGATLDRLAPPGSQYRSSLTGRVVQKVGALRALRRDYEAGYLATLHGLVRAEVFADFIEMAEHLLAQGYKDPCAVLVGGVLEEHLRALCSVHAIALSVSGRPKRADSMNNDLAVAGAYNRLDQKNITAWLDLRNKAAHAQYGEYTEDQVRTMIGGVREFAARTAA